MALFGLGNRKEGGIMDAIRCDEEDYLIWKWSPADINSKKENAIRYGSSLRVKDGEVAVFVYKQADGTMQDYVEGPFDQTVKTANLPILTGIVGSAFGGASPFQAEIYYINLAENIVMPFSFDIGDIIDIRSNSFNVPVRVNGQIIFNIVDYKQYIKINRMREFTLEELKRTAKENIIELLNGVVTTLVRDRNISITQLPGHSRDVSGEVSSSIATVFKDVYGLNVKSVAISGVKPDTQSPGYIALIQMLQATELNSMQTDNIVLNKNKVDMQQVSIDNTEDALRIQREETQRYQRLQTESANLATHQLNLQADVAKTAAESLGKLGGMRSGAGEKDGFNPAGIVTGMMMGSVVGNNMTNMMGNMIQGVNTPKPPTPPPGMIAEFYIAANGQQSGPYTVDQLRLMMTDGSFSNQTYVWKNGMANWEFAAEVTELAPLFAALPPPVPGGMPPPIS